MINLELKLLLLPVKNKKIVFSKSQINTFAKTLTLYTAITVGLPFIIVWGAIAFGQVKDIVDLHLSNGFLGYLWAFIKIYLWIMFGLLIGIISHELIHALTFMLITGKGFKAIEFSFIQKPFIPYVHYKEPISILAYRIGVAMPGILLGIVPSIVGLWIGNAYLTLFGIIFTGCSAGDFLILKATKGLNNDIKIRDLADHIGFEVVS